MGLGTSDASMCVVADIIKPGSGISFATPLACRVRQH